MSYGHTVLCPMALESYALWSCVLWSYCLMSYCLMSYGHTVICPMVLLSYISYGHTVLLVLQLYVLLSYSLVSLRIQSYVLGNINIQSHGTGVLYHGTTSGTRLNTTVAKEVCWQPYLLGFFTLNMHKVTLIFILRSEIKPILCVVLNCAFCIECKPGFMSQCLHRT